MITYLKFLEVKGQRMPELKVNNSINKDEEVSPNLWNGDNDSSLNFIHEENRRMHLAAK